LARFEKVTGSISAIQPSRSFIDGVLCRRIEFTGASGGRRELSRVFFTLKLASYLKADTSGDFFFWNSHCYAFKAPDFMSEDIAGARTSYFKRDAQLLLLMALSLVLLPIAIFILAKKLLRAGSKGQMASFLSS
jgi:hypothetical protein